MNSSIYGYKRQTTEFLEKLKEESLFAENNYSNCAHTGCSIASLLTGKDPLKTKVIFPPDILAGKNAYEHLPGILQSSGYRTIDISVRHYADAYDLNIRRGFDRSNGRSENIDFLSVSEYRQLQGVTGDAGYFLRQSYERLQERVFHLVGVQEMQNSYQKVTVPWRLRDGNGMGQIPSELMSFLSLLMLIVTVFLHISILWILMVAGSAQGNLIIQEVKGRKMIGWSIFMMIQLGTLIITSRR